MSEETLKLGPQAELIAKGQEKEVLELLYSVNLELHETANKPGFKITQRR